MNAIYAFLNIVAPNFVEGGWNDPIDVISFGLALIITPLALWWFFGGFARLFDRLTDKALDMIPNPPPLIERQEKELLRSRKEIANQPDPAWAKPASIIFGLLILVSIVSAVCSMDWRGMASNPLLWIAAIFAAFIFAAETGAKIDRMGWKAQTLAFLTIVSLVGCCIYLWVTK